MVRLSVVGRMVRDAKINDPADGKKACCTFTLAVNEYAGSNPDGTPKYESIFVSCKAFERTATAISKCVKGDVLEVHGNVKADVYEKDGKYMPSLNCVVREWERVSMASSAAPKEKPVATVEADTEVEEDIFN